MTDMTVSQTMLSQLGGNRFIAMTGSKNFVGSDDALSFKLVPNQSKAKYMRIVLTSMDGKRGRSNPVAVTFRGYSVRPFNGQLTPPPVTFRLLAVAVRLPLPPPSEDEQKPILLQIKGNCRRAAHVRVGPERARGERVGFLDPAIRTKPDGIRGRHLSLCSCRARVAL